MSKGIQFPVAGPWPKGQCDVKPCEVKGPACLTGVQTFGRTDIFEVLVVISRNGCNAPSNYSSRANLTASSSVSNVIVYLCWTQATGKEEAGGWDGDDGC